MGRHKLVHNAAASAHKIVFRTLAKKCKLLGSKPVTGEIEQRSTHCYF